ncbi:MAG TPA: HEPN domain-containing protein [Longimicrobiaceae bacterium]|nr:HEPN domain-containing protein [Longimicrobiaceae bacterium]
MPPEEGDATGSPAAWLRFAREDLALAATRIPNVRFGLHCFHAQQAAEKAIKAVLVARGMSFPFTHDLGRLIDLLEVGGVLISPEVRDADLLTDFAAVARYPGAIEIDEDDWRSAVASARIVIAWAERELG